MDRSETPYRRVGSGEPVLLIHPFALSHHVWHATADLLSADHDVLAASMPGHWCGERIRAREVSVAAYADGLERVLDGVGWETCHVVGNSLGGWLAFELERRGRARSVTAIAPAGGWANPSWDELRLGAIFLGLAPLIGLGRVLGDPATRIPLVRRQSLRLLSRDVDAVSERDFRTVVRAATHCSAYLPTEWMGLRDGGIRGLGAVQAPTRLVLCEHDVLLPVDRYARRFLDELPSWARRTVLPGVGHVPMLEDPQLVADTIREHVGEVVAGKSRGHVR
ncbi:alpha/beta hydrolase [Rhodococcus spelaei]|uniref:Alpha/beta hydrolase n=1 Tax=Rhodococcus spelaei TaxID=2546320 RepID=A0A541B122_9NOCA|nr:alpha/beta hydrolase [Rhodococcus spelaei]TQF66012.1 alpha/beta hydrolase [Rhodococcus spelaei]